MQSNSWQLHRLMLRARLFEEAVRTLWLQGLISGEMHLGLGEEGIAATALESGFDCRFRRVCTETTIPYSRKMEDETLPNVERIIAAATDLLNH